MGLEVGAQQQAPQVQLHLHVSIHQYCNPTSRVTHGLTRLSSESLWFGEPQFFALTDPSNTRDVRTRSPVMLCRHSWNPPLPVSSLRGAGVELEELRDWSLAETKPIILCSVSVWVPVGPSAACTLQVSLESDVTSHQSQQFLLISRSRVVRGMLAQHPSTHRGVRQRIDN